MKFHFLLFASVFNTSLFLPTNEEGLIVSIHYEDHPLAAVFEDYILIDPKTKNYFKLEIEEVTSGIQFDS